MSEEGLFAIVVSVLLSTFRVSVPLVLAGMGGIFSERSGVVNIALEGLMLVGAFAAATASHFSHSPWLGALAGVAAGVALAAIYALFVIEARSDQIVAGTAINLFAFGITPLLAKTLFDSTGATPSLELAGRFSWEPLVFAPLIVVAIAVWFRRSRAGLWLSFAGEHPEALSTAGIGVKKVRWFGVLMAGALAGLGGATLSIFLSSSFSRGMTAGRGFMALAALIFGKWKPVPTLLACLFFGLTDAVQIRLQGVPIFGDAPIPVQFIQILPYVFTIFVLAGFMGKSRPPKALGAPWVGMLAVVSLLGLSGCQVSLRDVVSRLKGTEQALSVPASPLPVSQDKMGRRLRSSIENAEMLAEANRVIFLREPRDPEAFARYRSAMDQGASFEGILNGLLHSSGYRELESSSPPAQDKTRKFFAAELAKVQAELQDAQGRSAGSGPIPIWPTSAQPLAKAIQPSGPPGSGASASPFGFERASAPALYDAIFRPATLPTLKRVLAEAIMARVDADFAKTTPRLLGWYASTAARLAGEGADLGLKARSSADEAFHRRWADALFAREDDFARDRLLWEALNRYFRILNHLEGSKENP
jgi:simple sugar transport system permease protein